MNKFIFWNNIDNVAVLDRFHDRQEQAPTIFTINSKCGIAHQEHTITHPILVENSFALVFIPTDLAAYNGISGQPAAQAILDEYTSSGNIKLSAISEGVSLLIFDKRSSEILASTDKFASAQLFYSQIDEQTIISNQLSLLTTIFSTPPTINNQAIFNFIDSHVIPSPMTIYQNIYKFEPAQSIKFSSGTQKKSLYWLPEFDEQLHESLDTLKERTREALRQSVMKHDASETTATFLSGGLDSSTVTGYLARNTSRTVNAYSMGFEESGYDETEYAKIAAKYFGTHLKSYYVTPGDVASAFSDVVRGYDEPFGNSSAIPTYLCAKVARQDGMTTLLAGDGGDELFAGNVRYAKQYLFEPYKKIPAALRKHLIEALLLNDMAHTRHQPFAKFKSYIEQANTPMPDRMERYNFINYFSAEKIFNENFLTSIDQEYPLNEKRCAYNRPHNASMLNRMLYMEWKSTLADNDLVKVNGACAMAGMAVRYPMLSDELVELSTKIPSNLKLKGQHLRYFYKQSLRGFLPEQIINKKKHGFGLPFGEWLKKSPVMQEHIYDNLNALKKRAYIKPEFIDHIIKIHRTQDSASYYGTMVWILAVLNEWLESRNH